MFRTSAAEYIKQLRFSESSVLMEERIRHTVCSINNLSVRRFFIVIRSILKPVYKSCFDHRALQHRLTIDLLTFCLTDYMEQSCFCARILSFCAQSFSRRGLKAYKTL